MKLLETENKTVNWKYLIIFGFAALILVFIYVIYVQQQNNQRENGRVLEVFSPTEGQIITEDVYEGFSIEVSGKSDFLKSSTRVVIKDGENNILAKETVAPLLSLLTKSSFLKEIQLKEPSTSKGVVRIYEETSGGEILKEISIPITFEYLERTPPEFREDRIISILLERGMVFYLKNGNIWKADVSDKDSVRKEVFLDKEEDVLMFAISPDDKYLAYTTDQFDLALQKYSGDQPQGSSGFGDTILLYNIETGEEDVVYENDEQEYMEIASMLFGLNNNTLYLSNNSVWAIDLAGKNLQKFNVDTLSRRGICSFYYLEELSPDGSLLMVKYGCFGEGSRFLVDIGSREITNSVSSLTSYPYGDIYGFIGNETLLGFYDPSASGLDGRADFYEINLYNLDGGKKKEILIVPNSQPDSPPYRDRELAGFCDRKLVSECYICVDDCSKNLYQVDKDTYELIPILEPKDIFVLQTHRYAPLTEYTLWLTDTHYSEPLLIDQELDSFFIGLTSF